MATEPHENQLDDVQEQIDEARKKAEEAVPTMDDDERRYYESGTVGEDKDDQQIAPPG